MALVCICWFVLQEVREASVRNTQDCFNYLINIVCLTVSALYHTKISQSALVFYIFKNFLLGILWWYSLRSKRCYCVRVCFLFYWLVIVSNFTLMKLWKGTNVSKNEWLPSFHIFLSLTPGGERWASPLSLPAWPAGRGCGCSIPCSPGCPRTPAVLRHRSAWRWRSWQSERRGRGREK